MSKFYEEVFEQPKALRDTIQGNQTSFLPDGTKPLLFTGMGSSLAAAELVVGYLNHHGYSAQAIDNSEILHYFIPMLGHFQVVVISQSGESYEAREIIKQLDDYIAITNTPTSTLGSQAKQKYLTYADKEQAIASSKSFTTTAALLLLLGSRLLGKDLSSAILQAADVLESQLTQADAYRQQMARFIDPYRPLVLLGRGPSIATARQGALTLKETARMFTEAQSAPQFRHGPFELIKENLQAIFFNPRGITYEVNQKYVLEMADLGAKVLYVADEPLDHANVSSITIPSIDEFVSVIPYSLVTQLAAVELSEKRGLVAGEASIISKVTSKE